MYSTFVLLLITICRYSRKVNVQYNYAVQSHLILTFQKLTFSSSLRSHLAGGSGRGICGGGEGVGGGGGGGGGRGGDTEDLENDGHRREFASFPVAVVAVVAVG